MKKRFRIILGCILFSIGFCVLFSFAWEILRTKTGGQSMDMIHSLYELDDHSVDVLCLGSSHGYYSISPNVIWEKSGITSYVLGSPQQTIPSSYFLLKEALKTQQPKVVVLESFYFVTDDLYKDESRVRQAFDKTRLDDVKIEMIDTFFPDMSFREKLTYYIPFIKYHSRWSSLQSCDFRITTPYLRGAALNTNVYKNKDRGTDVPAVEIPETSRTYFEKMLDLCQENDIAMVVYTAPFNSQNQENYLGAQGTSIALESYLDEKNIPYLFYQKTGEAGIDFETDFCDFGHLNLNGQTKLSRCLAQYLTREFGLENHKNDPAYSSYQDDYERYLKALKNKNVTLEGDDF